MTLLLTILTICLITIAVAMTSYAKDNPRKFRRAVGKFLSGFIPLLGTMILATVLTLAIF